MLTQYDEIELIIKYMLGENIKRELLILVNGLLDKGIWCTDFDVAVSCQNLDDYGCESLIRSLSQRNKLPKGWMCNIRNDLTGHLSECGHVPLAVKLIDMNNVIIACDCIILRYTSDGLKWISKRTTCDRVEIEGVVNNIVNGRSLEYIPVHDEYEWISFEMDYQTGKTLYGGL